MQAGFGAVGVDQQPGLRVIGATAQAGLLIRFVARDRHRSLTAQAGLALKQAFVDAPVLGIVRRTPGHSCAEIGLGMEGQG